MEDGRIKKRCTNQQRINKLGLKRKSYYRYEFSYNKYRETEKKIHFYFYPLP